MSARSRFRMSVGQLFRAVISRPPGFARLLLSAIIVLLPLWTTGASLASGSAGHSNVEPNASSRASSTAPFAAFKVSPRFGALPLKVRFDASASHAASGRAIASYTWDFGDGTPKKTGVKTSHTFTTAKYRTVKLTIVDSKGSTASAIHSVDAGNTAPWPTISSPSSTLLFSTGAQLTLNGRASDPQEGALGASSLTWEVRYNHGGLSTSLLAPTKGNNVKVTVPQPADIASAVSSTIAISLTATDATGLHNTVVKTLKPKLVTLNIVTDPPGANVKAGNVALTGPGSVQTCAGSTVSLNALGGISSTGQQLAFSSWSDGGAASHTMTAPASETTLTATFSSVNASPFAPIADATVRDSQPDANDGSSTILNVRSSGPKQRVYLKFKVAGASGAPVSAKVYLYALTSSTNTPAIYATSNDWTEMGLTWATRPAPAGGPLPGASGVSAGSWVAFDVSGAISGDGTYSFVLLRDSKTTAEFVSREGGDQAPRLMLTFSGEGGSATVDPPRNLAGLPFSATAIDLSWDPPSPSGGVTSYEIERDGTIVTTTGLDTAYRDLGLNAKTTYAYRVRAKTANGASDWTPPVEVTTPAPTTSNVVIAKSSTFVSEDSSVADDYESATLLRVRGGVSPSVETYLKFVMPSLSGTVLSAELHVFIPASPASGSGGSISLYGASHWEMGMTWANRAPRHPVDPYDTASSLPAGDWITLRPPDGTFGSGEVSYVLASNSDALTYITRSGPNAPRLVIIAFQGAAGASSVSTATPEPTSTPIAAEPTATPEATTAPAASETPAPEPTESATEPPAGPVEATSTPEAATATATIEAPPEGSPSIAAAD